MHWLAQDPYSTNSRLISPIRTLEAEILLRTWERNPNIHTNEWEYIKWAIEKQIQDVLEEQWGFNGDILVWYVAPRLRQDILPVRVTLQPNGMDGYDAYVQVIDPTKSKLQ